MKAHWVMLLVLCGHAAWSQSPVTAPPPPPPVDGAAAIPEVEARGPQVETYARSLKNGLMAVHIGWGGLKLWQAGEEHEFGLMDPSWLDMFERVPAAHELALQARTLQVVGMGLTFGGLIVEIGAGVVIPFLISASLPFVFVLMAVALLGGSVGITGAIMMNRAQTHMLTAVHRYNAGLINEGLPTEEQIDLQKLESKRTELEPSFVLARF